MQIHLLDGTYELFRFFSVDALSREAPDGREVGATLAFGRSLLALLEHEGATHVGVAFDHVIESFRNDLFAGYKTGAGVDPKLLAQFDLAEEMAAALGFVVWPMVEFEADDAMAAAAAKFAEDPRVSRILLMSPDKDLAQCVTGSRIVGVDRRRKTTMDETGVREKFGVAPESIPDWLALVGDRADGVPGVPMWGAKTAAAALSVHRHFDNIPLDPTAWRFPVRGAAALAKNLRAHLLVLRLYRTLTTLRTDVEMIPESADDLLWRGADRERLIPLCESFGETSLIDRVPAWRD